MTITDPAVEDPTAEHRRRVNAALDTMIEHRADLGLVIEFLAGNAGDLPRFFTHHVTAKYGGGFRVGVACGPGDELEAFARVLARGARSPLVREQDPTFDRVSRSFGTAELCGFAARCTGTSYLVNPDYPEEGTDIRHEVPCPTHPDAVIAEPESPAEEKVVDLMQALEDSVAAAKEAKRAHEAKPTARCWRCEYDIGGCMTEGCPGPERA